jgi:hypothetical protein
VPQERSEATRSISGSSVSSTLNGTIHSDSSASADSVINRSGQQLRTTTMSNMVKIRPFKGLADCGEDPEEYIDDVQMAAEAWEPSNDAANLEKTLLRFFRQNLEPNFEAAWWWQGLSKADRGQWAVVKAAFLKKFSGTAGTGTEVDYDETNEILALAQKAGQSIEEYVREAEKLSRRIKPVLKHTLAAAVIKGLQDEQKRREVSFALSGTKYDFDGAVEKIMAAYRCIGEPDPFKPKDIQKAWGSNNPFWSTPVGVGAQTMQIPVMSAMGPPPIPVMAAIGHRRTSSHDSEQHQRADPAGRPSTSDGLSDSGIAGKISQEEFNKYMDAYMRRQKGQDFQQPSQGPDATAPAAKGVNPWITCYACGQKGHRSVECTGKPLSWEDQLRVRERVAMEVQEYRARRSATTGFSPAAPASSPNTITVSRVHPVMENHLGEGNSVDMPRVMPRVNNIQVVRMGNSQATMEAFAMLQRVPGVMQAIRNAAMAVKRTQEEAELDTEDAGKEKLRKMADSPGINASEQQPVEQAVDPVQEVEPQNNAGTDLDSLKGLISQEVDKAIRRVARQDDTVLQAPSIPTATRPRTYAPIRLMKNETKYDLECILRDIVPKISLPQLLDISPGLRQELKDLLQSTIPRLRKRRTPPIAAFNTVVEGVPPVVTSMAADDKDMSCMYIESYVGGYRVSQTLVDGGAQIELVSEKVVRHIGCTTYTCKDTAMRLANDSIVPLPCYAWLDVNVGGVLSRVKTYVMPIEMSFSLLLSRRWLSRVQAIENHSSNTLHIRGTDGVVHLVQGTPAPASVSIGIASQQKMTGLEEFTFDDTEAAEQAIDILLDELDHWEEDNQTSGNGQRLR